MRRIVVSFVALGGLLGAACSREPNTATTTGVTSAFDAPPPAAATTIERVSEAVCAGRGAANVGIASAAVLQQSGTDFDDLAEDMRRAASAAPEAIRADFGVLVDAQLPFLELLAQARATENYATLAQSSAFQASVARLARPEVAQATARVNAWFAQHCPAD